MGLLYEGSSLLQEIFASTEVSAQMLNKVFAFLESSKYIHCINCEAEVRLARTKNNWMNWVYFKRSKCQVLMNVLHLSATEVGRVYPALSL